MTDPRRDLLPMREAQHSFDVVLRGYDRHQVAETIERLEADIRVALADRDAAAARVSDLAGQLSAMHAEIDELRRKAANQGPATFENMSGRISHMLRLAEEEAAEIRSTAEQEARALREQTAAEERAMLERHAAGQAEVERMLAEARQNAEQIASKAQIRADELVTKAQEKVARLEAESHARRTKVEEDFEIAQRARRMDAARLEEERERASIQAAQERVAAAEAHAARVVGEAEASAAAIRRVRDELTARLTEARRVLTALPDLADRPQQRPGVPQQVQQQGQHPQAPSQPGQQQRPGATEEVRVQRREPEGPQTAVQPVAGPPTAVQPAVGPQTAVQRAVGPQTGGQPAGTRPSPHPRGPETPARGAGEAAAAQQPTRSPASSPQSPSAQSPSAQAPSTQPAAPQAETPSSEQTQQIRPVHTSGQDEGRHSGGSTRVTEQARPAEDAPAPEGPPTLVQPAASPRDTGSQPAVPGRR
jgi:cell division septum initiation protein DivIVA